MQQNQSKTYCKKQAKLIAKINWAELTAKIIKYWRLPKINIHTKYSLPIKNVCTPQNICAHEIFAPIEISAPIEIFAPMEYLRPLKYLRLLKYLRP